MHIHGGNVYKASQVYGIKAEDILDYSANINPLGLPEGLKELLISGFDSIVNYPDPEYTELKKYISGYLKVAEECIIPGNGATEIIYLLFETLKLKRILIPAPAFDEYAQAAHAAAIETDFFELKEENNFKLVVEELLDKIRYGYDAVMLCNPNNPTSTLLSREELYKILKFTSARGIYFIIDEAFIELTVGGNGNSMKDALVEFNNLFIIRAFTKIFAVPGLRLGYGLGNAGLVKEMWNRKMPWSINSLACSAARILENCGEYLEKTSQWLKEEKERFYRELSSIKGLKVFEPQTNFILIKILLPSLNVGTLKDYMGKKGILIRDASNFRFLNDKFFRVAIKDKKSNIRFQSLLKEIMESTGKLT
ncbi:MAG TPA: threonine-phosphate decarboxylase [Clostridiaceae bacterium]|nr:threonine-phosphate decarboxylase [Clostridiaceae bacterium]